MTAPAAETVPQGWPTVQDWQTAAGTDFLPSAWPNREVSRRVYVGATRWHVQRMGSGRRLLLIHGTAASTHSFRDLLPLLAQDFDVLAMDLPGHGYTDRLPGNGMSLPEIARGISEQLGTIDFDPRYVVGHSAGAAIAIRMVLDRSIRPDAIVGLNAALLPFGGPFKQLFAPLARFFANTRLMPQMVSRRAQDERAVKRVLDGTGSELDAAGTRMYQQLLTRSDHVAAVLAMMASWDLGSLLDELPGLQVPLHLFVGMRDRAVSPGEADKVASVVPGSAIVRLPDCGHLAHEERPDLVSRRIAECFNLPEARDDAVGLD